MTFVGPNYVNAVLSTDPSLTWAIYESALAGDQVKEGFVISTASYVPLNLPIYKGETYYCAVATPADVAFMVLNPVEISAEN